MLEILSGKGCKILDKEAIDKIGIPSIVLMENAASALFNEIKDKGESFIIVCGRGNNGGDGLALARKLYSIGKIIKIVIISDNHNHTDDFLINYNILKRVTNNNYIETIDNEYDISNRLGASLCEYDVIVDCIFGVGINREVSGIYKTAINFINQADSTIIAVDVPSGMDCNTGQPQGIAVKADYTYSFEVMKRGFLNYEALEYTGELKVLSIGIPHVCKQEKSEGVYILEKEEYSKLLPKRNIYGHKGNYRRALIFAGSRGFTGAAFITTECTVRSGAGLTTLVCPKDIQEIMSYKLIEAMTVADNDEKVNELIEKCNSIAIGPGLGINKKSESILEKVIKNSKCPLVFDADAIRILGKRKDLLKYIEGRALITPHPGEMADFLNKTIQEVEADRIDITIKTAQKYNIIVLLKGYNTVISNGIRTYINRSGNSKMASGGMGDALTGIINGFCSQKIELLNSALLGAYIHGFIADEVGRDSYIVNARDIINNIPKLINKIIK